MLGQVLLVSIALLCPLSRVDDYSPSPVGPLEVRDSGVLTLHDEARDKNLQIRVRFPVRDDRTDGDHAGAHPLIIFSHGAGGSCDAFVSLSTCLASHGYVVVHPTHSDSLALEQGKDRRQAVRRVLRQPSEIVSRVDLPDRVADVKFLLDAIDTIEERIGQEGLVDRQRVGMAGHSAGAMTTQVLGGMEFRIGRMSGGDRLEEPRFDAFALISGQGTNRRAITEDSWNKVDRPWLVLAGSKDVSAASNETPESRRHPFEFAPADGTKYLVFIDGATHSSYQGKVPGALLDRDRPANLAWIEQTTNLSVLAFFDAYVKGDQEAKAWLDAGKSVERDGGEAEFLHK
ncbi:MAG: hypothetical protein KJZ65_13540 [Phycisphaerales bacterium]|nr:hypothetical protein [Phycisphaerales bacterium]